MLVLSGLLAIGIHLLISTKVSYSLVLLTANLEDIKKIAKQFVSETVADQIGRLFLQTNTKQNISISEENNLNNDVNKVSSENFEVPRANKTSSEDVKKILKDAMQRIKEMKYAVNDVTKRQKKPKEKRKTTTKSLDYYTYDFILSPEKTIKPKYEWKKGLNFDFLSTTNTVSNNKENENIKSFTRGIVSEKEGNSEQNKIDNPSSDHESDPKLKKTFKRIEPGIQRLKYNKSEVKNKKHDKENKIKPTKLRTENTTENVLDYYDNSIYIKKEIVATSGPIELFKATSSKELSSTSSEYSVDTDEHVNVNLYFRKLLDLKMRKYNDNKEIKAKIANITLNTSNKIFKNIVTTKVPFKVTNSTKQVRKIKEKPTNDLSYLDESYELVYSN